METMYADLSIGKHIHEQVSEKSTYSESWTEARFRGKRLVGIVFSCRASFRKVITKLNV
jgi:hypothetical protein